MLKSMTAFASAQGQAENTELVWEIRSVNHRYLEVLFRLPEEFRVLEVAAREMIQQRLGRGKLDCSLRYSVNRQAATSIDLNTDMVAAVIDACNQIDMQMGQGVAMNALDVLRYPGVVVEQKMSIDALRQAALDCLSQALNDLIESRQREGERLHGLLSERASTIKTIVSRVRENRPSVNEAIRLKLQKRLQDVSIEFDQSRLEQELVIMLQKMDVDEELDRLDAHVEELFAVFSRNEPVGRRLDFLMQEFNREANTLGSKSSDIDTTQAAVELKVLIEQMREQVQNIE